MPNWKFVKRQLKFGKGTYSQRTHKPKTKTHIFYDKNNALFIYLFKRNVIIILLWNYGLKYLCNDYIKHDLEHMV